MIRSGLITLIFFGWLIPLRAFVIYSEYVKDNFNIYVNIPENYSKLDANCSVVFYMDANLYLGQHISRLLKVYEDSTQFKQTIFVGVAHTGDWHKQRSRDFIPPIMRKGKFVESTNPNKGHADKFYQFITLELIPYINKNYPNNGKYNYVGHSYSGLFGFYCLFQDNPVFVNYVLISPSLWENSNNFFAIEENFYDGNHQFNQNHHVYHLCGKAEWGNLVLPTSRKMKKRLMSERSYFGFWYTYVEFKRKGHIGMIETGLTWAFHEVYF